MPSRRDVLATAGAGSFGLLAGCIGGDDPVHGDWPRAGYDDRNSGYAPRHHGPKSNPVVTWSADVPSGQNASSPVLVNDSVYIGYANDAHPSGGQRTVGVRVFDIQTGERTNDFTVSTYPGSSYDGYTLYRDSVVHANGNLYLQAFDGVHSLTTAGKKRWHVSMHGDSVNSNQRTAHPVIADGFVYAPTASVTSDSDGAMAKEGLYAIDDSTGKVAWKYSVPATKFGWTFPPAYADGVVYLAALEDGVFALDAKSGDVLWKQQLSAYGPPVVADGRVYVSAEIDNGKAFVVALDAETGNEQWRVSGRGTRLGRRLAVANGRVYFSEYLRNFVALDAATGKEIWRHNYPEGVHLGTPAVTKEAIYVGVKKGSQNEGLAVLDPNNGEEVAFVGIGNEMGIRSSIVLSDGLAVASGDSDTVYAFESCGFELLGHCLS